jgi:hypothetical protein
MDVILDLIQLLQQWQINRHSAQAASLEHRVANLESQLAILHQVVLAFAKELRPDLMQQVQAAVPPTKPAPFVTPANGWRVSYLDENNAELPLPAEFGTEEEAKAEARRLVDEGADAKIFVTGWQGRRYRVLP